VLTDPPYGINRHKGFDTCFGLSGFNGAKRILIDRRIYPDDGWDNERPNIELFNEILRISKETIIFGGNYFADILPRSFHWLVWDKKNTMPTFSDCELIWTNIDRNSTKIYRFEFNGLIGKEKERYHPTQKPTKLIGNILQDYSEKDMTIFDPFMGSGTTGVACVQLERNFIGCEISKDYYEIAKERIEEAQNTLFNEPVEKELSLQMELNNDY